MPMEGLVGFIPSYTFVWYFIVGMPNDFIVLRYVHGNVLFIVGCCR